MGFLVFINQFNKEWGVVLYNYNYNIYINKIKYLKSI
jgi:hypothetical protein